MLIINHNIRATGQSTVEITTIARWSIRVNSVCVVQRLVF